MQYIGYSKPKLLIADKGKMIRAKDDIYIPAKYDEEGNIIEKEHIPYHSTVIFLADNFEESKINDLYYEEEI